MASAESSGPGSRASLERLVLFDGVCGFCDWLVRWLVERDPRGRLRFAPLQGTTAKALRERHPEIPEELETLVLVESDARGERVFLESEAAFRVFAALEGPARHWARLRVLPRALTDLLYRLFVRHRYRVFGRLDACRLPDPSERARFLD